MRQVSRCIAWLRPFALLMTLAMLFGVVAIASDLGLLGMAAYLISAAALRPLLVALMLPIYAVQFLSVSRAVGRYMERLLSHNVTFQLLARLRVRVYATLEPLLPARLLAYRSGDVLTRLVADVDELQHVYLRVVAPFVVAGVVAIVAGGVFALFSPVLAWTVVACLAATGIIVPGVVVALSQGLGREQVRLRAELHAQLVESLQGVPDVLACGREEDRRRDLARLDAGLGRVQRRLAWITGVQQAGHDLLANLTLVVVLVLAIPLVGARSIDGAYLAFLALVALTSFEAVQPLGPALQFLGHATTAGARVSAVLDAAPAVTEPAAPALAPLGRTLEFDHVRFAYAVEDGVALDDISFHVACGERVAVVGPSGAGKSSLVRLAVRFWDPVEGAVRLDGRDVRTYALADLRHAVGVVAQDAAIFNDTLRGNLTLGRPNASEEEIARAVEGAQLADFVAQLPDGLATWVSEQGLRLSGGERQRLAIARALLADAPLLLLDEPTANLDPLTERALLAALDTLLDGRTVLTITHRLVNMERMDRIFVLHAGRIVERGTHRELLARQGFYAQMLEMQHGTLAMD